MPKARRSSWSRSSESNWIYFQQSCCIEKKTFLEHSCVRFVMPDGTSWQLVFEEGVTLCTVERRVSHAVGVGQHVELKCGDSTAMIDRFPNGLDNVMVMPLMAPRTLCDSIPIINATPLGPSLRLSPSLSLKPRILNAFRARLEQGVRQMLTIGVDLESGTASVGSRPVSSVERAEAPEDPRFDDTGLRMLAAFDARRVVPVLIVMCRPSFVYLYLNSLPWSDGVAC